MVLAVDFLLFLGVAYWYEYKFDWYHLKSTEDAQPGDNDGSESDDVFSIASSQLAGPRAFSHKELENGTAKKSHERWGEVLCTKLGSMLKGSFLRT